MNREDFFYQVYGIVSEIPKGKVLTYGEIAKMMNHPKHARLVGTALKYASFYGDFPCHRVVNQSGRIAPYWPEQRTLLEQEGVLFKNGKVDISNYLWKIKE